MQATFFEQPKSVEALFLTKVHTKKRHIGESGTHTPLCKQVIEVFR